MLRRQHVPGVARRALAPGARVMALAHERDRDTAVVDWVTMAERLGVRMSVLEEPAQFAWPDRGEWPAERAIEVRDRRRHEQRLAERRRDWAAATGAAARRHDARQDQGPASGVDAHLELPDGRIAAVEERMPSLARARLCEYRAGAAKLGGLASSVDLVVLAGAPIEVLREPGGSGLEVDWRRPCGTRRWRSAIAVERGVTPPVGSGGTASRRGCARCSSARACRGRRRRRTTAGHARRAPERRPGEARRPAAPGAGSARA